MSLISLMLDSPGKNTRPNSMVREKWQKSCAYFLLLQDNIQDFAGNINSPLYCPPEQIFWELFIWWRQSESIILCASFLHMDGTSGLAIDLNGQYNPCVF